MSEWSWYSEWARNNVVPQFRNVIDRDASLYDDLWDGEEEDGK